MEGLNETLHIKHTAFKFIIRMFIIIDHSSTSIESYPGPLANEIIPVRVSSGAASPYKEFDLREFNAQTMCRRGKIVE